MSPQFPRPSVRSSHKIKGSNLQPGDSARSSDPAPSNPAGKSKGGSTAGPQGTDPKQKPTNDRLAVARSPAFSLSINQALLQAGAPATHCP